MRYLTPSRLFRKLQYVALPAIIIASGIAPSTANAAATYKIIDLGGLIPGSGCGPFAINDLGQVTGTAPASDGDEHAFLYDHGVIKDLGHFGVKPAYSSGFAINNAGTITGYSDTPDGDLAAPIYQNGQIVDPHIGRGSQGFGINDIGQITGEYASPTGFAHAYIYTNGAITDLGTFTNGYGASSAGYGINIHGVVTGWSQTNSYAMHAFVYQNGVMTDITPNSISSLGSAINNSGEIAGTTMVSNSYQHAFLYLHGVTTDLGVAAGYTDSTTSGMNNAGDVVGRLDGGSRISQAAFLYTHGAMTDLNNAIGPNTGWTLTQATGINNHGWITGYGYTTNALGDTQSRGFILEPIAVPEPTTWVSLSVGLIFIGFFRTRYRRKKVIA